MRRVHGRGGNLLIRARCLVQRLFGLAAVWFSGCEVETLNLIVRISVAEKRSCKFAQFSPKMPSMPIPSDLPEQNKPICSNNQSHNAIRV